jgi:hypothetical protein
VSTFKPTPKKIAASNAALMLSKSPKPARIGDIWHRVEGTWIDDGSESYQGMELDWTQWECVKTTLRGAWFVCIGRDRYMRKRFALTSGALALSRTEREALERLVARKVRQLKVLEGQKTVAEDTLEIAREALASM